MVISSFISQKMVSRRLMSIFKMRRFGCRNSTRFRIWATQRLKEYMIKGFVMDDERLKGNHGGTYWRELVDRIRDIRASEKVIFRQVLDLYVTSVDFRLRLIVFKTYVRMSQREICVLI